MYNDLSYFFFGMQHYSSVYKGITINLFTVSCTSKDSVHHPLPLIHLHQREQSIDYLVDCLDLVVQVDDKVANSCI